LIFRSVHDRAKVSSLVASLALVGACGNGSGDAAGAGAGGTGGAVAGAGGAGAGAGGVVAGSGGASGGALGGAGAGGDFAGTSGAAGAAGGGAGDGGSSGVSGSAGSGAGSGGVNATGCIVPATSAAQPVLLSQTGCVDPSDPKRPAPALIPYDVNSALWSDGAEKERYVSLPVGAKITAKDCDVTPERCMPAEAGGTGEDEGHWDLPIGTVLMKTFLIGGKRIETRLFNRFSATVWRGFSYEWDDAETDATLLPDFKDKDIGGQTWHYPSRNECFECHTEAGGRSLGPTTAQLDREFTYADGTMNQIDKFVALGWFDAKPKAIPAYPDPFGPAPLEQRARAYIHANCSICHRSGGVVADVDLRYTTSFADTDLCNEMIFRGVGDAMLPQVRLVPGSPSESNLSFRMHDTTTYRMPKIGSSVVDPMGTALIDEWISSIQSCP
jgi:hypothetical protein